MFGRLEQGFSATTNFKGRHYAAGQFAVGLDYRVTPHWLVGMIGDYTYTSGTWDGRNFTANTFRGGVYTSVWKGGWYGTRPALTGNHCLSNQWHYEWIGLYRLPRDRVRLAIRLVRNWAMGRTGVRLCGRFHTFARAG